MGKVTQYDAFHNQWQAAKRRGIKFEFSFKDWVKWWKAQLGPNWWTLRGQGRGKYQMGRIGDNGPYSPLNTICILHEKNSYDAQKGKPRSLKYCAIMSAAKTGEKNGHAKLTEAQVLEIYFDSGPSTKFAQKYGITKTVVYEIRNKRTWRHLTKDLPPWYQLCG